MVRQPCYDSRTGLKKGAWSEDEDNKLRAHVQKHGHRNWRLVPILAGLARCGKSCRLRWVNYLKPGLRHGNFTKFEEELIIQLHSRLGSRWSSIAARLDGRTDHEIKNHWHAHLKKRSTQSKKSLDQTSSSSGFVTNPDHDHYQNEAFPAFDAHGNVVWAEASNDQACFNEINSDLIPLEDEEQVLNDLELCQLQDSSSVMFKDELSVCFESIFTSNGRINNSSSSVDTEERFSSETNLDAITLQGKDQALSAMNPEIDLVAHGDTDIIWAEASCQTSCFDQASLDFLPFSSKQPDYYDLGLLSNFATLDNECISIDSSWISAAETNFSSSIMADHQYYPEYTDAIRNILGQINSDLMSELADDDEGFYNPGLSQDLNMLINYESNSSGCCLNSRFSSAFAEGKERFLSGSFGEAMHAL